MIIQKLTQTEKQQLSDGSIRLHPIDRCIINHDWNTGHEAYIAFSRKLDNGNICASMYLIDFLCLGIKNVGFISELKPEDLENSFIRVFDMKISGVTMCNYSLIHYIIREAKEFALKYGISPDENFEYIGQMMDSEIPPLENMPKINFGQNGKPYLRMSKDDKNYDHYIAQLEKYAGAGNYYHTDFTFMAESAVLGGYLKHWNLNQWSDFIDHFDLENYTDLFPMMDFLIKKILKTHGGSDLSEKIEYFFNTYEISEGILLQDMDRPGEQDAWESMISYIPNATKAEAKKLLSKVSTYIQTWPDNVQFRGFEIQLKSMLEIGDLNSDLQKLIADFPDYLVGKLTYAIELANEYKLDEARILLDHKEMLHEICPDRKSYESREIVAFAHYMALDCIFEMNIFKAYVYSTMLFKIPPDPSYLDSSLFSMINKNAIAHIIDLIKEAKTDSRMKYLLISFATGNFL